MDVITGRMPSATAMSTLNPNAAPFVPSAYRSVEDYSDEWWALVRSTPWFRDYWLRECFLEEHAGDSDLDLLEFDDTLYDADADALFHSFPSPNQEEEEQQEEKTRMELMGWGAEKWKGARGRTEAPKYYQKVPKIVNVKVSPRMIQQPR